MVAEARGATGPDPRLPDEPSSADRPSALGPRPSLLAIGAHPDDETMLAGGTLAWAARAGLRVEILSVTRGEGGEVGEPPVTSQERLGEGREAEPRCAAQALRAAGAHFLPVPPSPGAADRRRSRPPHTPFPHRT